MTTIATYNLRKAIASDRRRRPERIIAVLVEMGADIVALQEADRRFGARAAALPPELLAETGWQVAPLGGKLGSLGWHGNAILFRSPVELLHCAPIDLPTLEPRGAVVADLRIGAHDLRVVGMHLDLSGLWRRRQARAIMAHLTHQSPHLPTLLMGDTNEWRLAGGCLKDFATDWRILSTAASFPARRPMGRLDRIMVGHGIPVLDSGVHDNALARTASDHLPVWARLGL